MVSLGKCAQDEVASEELQQRHGSGGGVASQPIPDVGLLSQENRDNEIHAKRTEQEATTPSLFPEKASQLPDAAVPTMQSDQEGSTSSIILEKDSLAPDTGIPMLQSGQEGSTPSIIREKVTEDGYNWRKYGQKLVKGNEFIRSYYKCTHPNCQVKKQLEKSHDGQITDTTYLGQHDHPKPQLNVPVAVGFALSVIDERPNEPSLTGMDDKSFVEHGQTPNQTEPVDDPTRPTVAVSDNVKGALSQTNRMRDVVDKDDDDDTDSKRQKKERGNIDAVLADKPTGEPRLVVQTLSEVDIVNDGFRWRKYGQKFVKGNPNPRSYYRCSSPGCPVKKHVERASHDPKVVIATYEAQHDHDMPPVRTVTHNAAGPNVCTTTHNGEAGSKSENIDAVCLDMVVRTSSGPELKSEEQLNGESKTESGVSNLHDFHVVAHSSFAPKEKANEQLNGKQSAESSTKSESEEKRTTKSEGDTVCLDMVAH